MFSSAILNQKWSDFYKIHIEEDFKVLWFWQDSKNLYLKNCFKQTECMQFEYSEIQKIFIAELLGYNLFIQIIKYFGHAE